MSLKNNFEAKMYKNFRLQSKKHYFHIFIIKNNYNL